MSDNLSGLTIALLLEAAGVLATFVHPNHRSLSMLMGTIRAILGSHKDQPTAVHICTRQIITHRLSTYHSRLFGYRLISDRIFSLCLQNKACF